MKKTLCIMFACLIAGCFCSCGGNKIANESKPKPATSAIATTTVKVTETTTQNTTTTTAAVKTTKKVSKTKKQTTKNQIRTNKKTVKETEMKINWDDENLCFTFKKNPKPKKPSSTTVIKNGKTCFEILFGIGEIILIYDSGKTGVSADDKKTYKLYTKVETGSYVIKKANGDWEYFMPYTDETVSPYCPKCGRLEGDGRNGTCNMYFFDVNCKYCGKPCKAHECHCCDD